MAPKRKTPTVRLRRLSRELRRLRAEAELSREDVAEQTSINNATLYRIETARARPQVRTLNALLSLYDVDRDQRAYLTELCRDAGKQGWLMPYHSDLPEEYTAFISFESEAQSIRNYSGMFIPGLLQTEEYARAVIRGGLTSGTEEEVEDRVRARMERQALLGGDNPLNLWAVIDEAALRRVVGGVEVMGQQLAHLIEMAKKPNITVQVMQFGAGAHPGMSGQFVLMEFEDPMDADLVYIDSMAGDLFLEADIEIKHYRTNFEHLVAMAASPTDLATLIDETADALKVKGGWGNHDRDRPVRSGLA